MLHLGLEHLLQTALLDQVHNPPKPRPHIRWQILKFRRHALVQELDNPSIAIIAFLKYH